jgi:hypothetical protein
MEQLIHLLGMIFLSLLIGYAIMASLIFVGIILLDMIYPTWKDLRDSNGKALFKTR